MAADTQLTAFNAKSRAQKLFRLPDGGVAGGCGLWSVAHGVLKFLAEGGTEDDDKLPEVKDAQILIARPDGSLWVIEDRFPAYPVLDSVAAIGCGVDAANMAMNLGLSAVEAVAKVTKQDALCGGPIQSMEVEETHEYSGVTTHGRKPKK